MSNNRQAKIWLVPASDPQSTTNIARSMEWEIDPAIQHIMQEKGFHSRFAWGAKLGKSETNRSKFARMEVGDLCLFYTADQRSTDEPPTAYRWMAKIQGKLEDQALADMIWPPHPKDPVSFPLIYFLTEPVRILLPAVQLSPLLDPQKLKYREGQRGFTSLAAENAKYVHQHFGSVAGFMQALLVYAQEDPPPADYPELYQPGSQAATSVATKSVSFSNGLLAVTKPRASSKQEKSTDSPPRRSRHAKETGDTAELLVYQLLQEGQIENVIASDVKHVAQKKKGWDIEYTNPAGEIVRVEVKGTSTSRFSNFELTKQEYDKLREHQSHYHFYLVASCLSSAPVIQIIDDMAQRLELNAASVTPITYRLELQA